MNVSIAIDKRRSVFPPMFTDAQIDDHTIISLLEAANKAPNHRNTEPWRFKIFARDRKKSLSTYLQSYYKEHTPTEGFSAMKYQKIAKKVDMSSHIIAICYKISGKVPEWEEIAATSCAVQNLWLAATEQGLGGYWSSPASMTAASQFLALDEDERCLGLFYLGVPQKELPLQTTKGNIMNKIEWV